MVVVEIMASSVVVIGAVFPESIMVEL